MRPTSPTIRPTVQPSSPTIRPSSPPPAQRTNPYTPEKVCGPGYSVQRQASFKGGTTYQLFNNATKNTSWSS